MKVFTMETLRSWGPCYDPNRHLPEDWNGTALDILKNEAIPFQDRLWVIFRTELVSDKLMRLFAVWSYRQTLDWICNPDYRSIEAAMVAEKYANGDASDSELCAASSAAYSAVISASDIAARLAAYSAADSTALKAERAGWGAALGAAESAAAAGAVWAAESAQQKKLQEMLLAGIETGDTK